MALSQDKRIDKLLLKLISVNEKEFHSDNFYEKSFMFSITIGVDKNGTVDTVITSDNGDKELNQLVDFNKIRKGLKGSNIYFKPHKNEVLVLLVSVIRGDYDYLKINNGNQYVRDWRAIIKNSVEIKIKDRPQIFLPPILIEAHGKGIKN